MRKIGKSAGASVIISFLFLLISILPASAQAQDFQLEATVSENRVFAGEQFVLSVEVRGSSMRDVSLPILPDIDGVRILSNTPSRSSSISIVNGRTTTSTTYSYTLIAREIGTQTIPPVRVEIDGEIYRTEPIEIEILDRGQLSEDGRLQMPDIFLEVEVDEENPVPGQQITASIVLYFKQGIEVTSFQPTAGWRTDGFWKEELQNVRQPQAESVILEGLRYRTATLMRYALFPTRSGTLTLSEFPLNVGIRSRSSRNDPFGSFFGAGGNQRRVNLESEPVEIEVRNLPQPRSDAIMMNAVGDLSISRSISKDRLVEGETLELTTEVNGTGNIPLVRRPEYDFPDNLEQYTPQERSNVERRGLTIRGEKFFTELLAPRAPGNYTIPRARVALFDPDRGTYSYVTLPELQFSVQAATGQNLSSAVSELQSLRPATGLAVWRTGDSSSVFGRFWFWLLLIIPLAAVIAAYQKKKVLNRLMSDRRFARSHRAEEVAMGRLQEARSLVDEGEAKPIYNLLQKALSGFISDKLGLQEAGLSDTDLIEELQKSEIDSNLVNKVRRILQKCATISYAPVGGRADFRTDIIATEKLISELIKQFE